MLRNCSYVLNWTLTRWRLLYTRQHRQGKASQGNRSQGYRWPRVSLAGVWLKLLPAVLVTMLWYEPRLVLPPCLSFPTVPQLCKVHLGGYLVAREAGPISRYKCKENWAGGAKGLLHMHLNFSAFKISGSLNFFTSICIHIYIYIYIFPQNIYAAKRPSPHFLIEGILIQCLGCSSPSPRPKKQIGCHRWSPLKPIKIAIDLGADISLTYVFFNQPNIRLLYSSKSIPMSNEKSPVSLISITAVSIIHWLVNPNDSRFEPTKSHICYAFIFV